MFGGSFNPIHNGHIALARKAIRSLKLTKLLIVPSNAAPHKSSAEYASAEHRVKMCRLAARHISKAEVSLIEVERSGISYTADTLEELAKIYPDGKLYLITGADMFLTLQDWHNPLRIFELAEICTVPRDEADLDRLRIHAELLSKMGAVCTVIDAPNVHISSTEVRRRVKSEESLEGLVYPEIERYIVRSGIYK